MATTQKTRKKKSKIRISAAQVHVQATFNNTIITVTDASGRVVSWFS